MHYSTSLPSNEKHTEQLSKAPASMVTSVDAINKNRLATSHVEKIYAICHSIVDLVYHI